MDLFEVHRHKAGERLDAVPKILDTDVLVLGVLIVVVIGDRHGDRGDIERFADDRERQAAAERLGDAVDEYRGEEAFCLKRSQRLTRSLTADGRRSTRTKTIEEDRSSTQ